MAFWAVTARTHLREDLKRFQQQQQLREGRPTTTSCRWPDNVVQIEGHNKVVCLTWFYYDTPWWTSVKRRPVGFEPTTNRLEGDCASLCYGPSGGSYRRLSWTTKGITAVGLFPTLFILVLNVPCCQPTIHQSLVLVHKFPTSVWERHRLPRASRVMSSV